MAQQGHVSERGEARRAPENSIRKLVVGRKKKSKIQKRGELPDVGGKGDKKKGEKRPKSEMFMTVQSK